MSAMQMARGNDVEPLPRQAGGDQRRDDRGSDDRADRKESLHRVHEPSVMRGRCRHIADQRKRARLEYADAEPGDAQQKHKCRKDVAHGKEQRACTVESEPQDDRALAPDAIRKESEQKGRLLRYRPWSRTGTRPRPSCSGGTQ